MVDMVDKRNEVKIRTIKLTPAGFTVNTLMTDDD
jgi:hypothetical protein